MSFTRARARIASFLIDFLVRRSRLSSVAHLLEGSAAAGYRRSQSAVENLNFLLTPQGVLPTSWALTAFKLMASTIVETDVSLVLKEKAKEDGCESSALQEFKVIFVLGGPGSGKGTQCALIVENFGFTHLSAGDLLRAEINSGNENGIMIQNMIKEGKIVPSEVTVKLLQNAMQKSGNDKFLIDGFPRNEENRAAFELVTGIQPEFILFFDCPEEELERRLLGRNQGRVDDNIETIRKRFKVFSESSLPVINHYNSFGKVRKVDASRTREEVFETVQGLLAPVSKATA